MQRCFRVSEYSFRLLKGFWRRNYSYQLHEDNVKLLTSTLQPVTPQSNLVLATISNFIRGRLTAKFYTDKWPHFSAVVCQIFYPRISEESNLYCYATSSEALIHVLKDNNLITWGKKQLIGYTLDSHTCTLTNILLEEWPHKLRPFFEKEMPYVYLPPSPLKGEQWPCPPGFRLGTLKLSHAEMVASHWNYFRDWPNRVSFFEGMIQNLRSTAIYSTEYPDSPVGWCMQYPNGELAHLYVLKEYRGLGLSTIVLREIFKSVMEDGIRPQVGTYSTDLFSQLGFVSAGTVVKWVVPYGIV